MKKAYKIALSLIVVLAMVATVFFVTPVRAEDQAQKRVETLISNPPGVTFKAIAWNENNYKYAIAVGYNSSNYGVVYRYDPGIGWTLVYSVSNAALEDVVYDTKIMGDTFYFVGGNAAFKIGNPGMPNQSVDDLGAASYCNFHRAAFDPNHGPSGTLIAVGTNTSSDDGLIAAYDIYTYYYDWNYVDTNYDDVLHSVAVCPNPDQVYVGGYESSSAVVYKYNYSSLTFINPPMDILDSYGMDWQPNPPDEVGYALVAAQNYNDPNYGSIWRLYENGTFERVPGVSNKTPILRDVDWKDDGSMALIVGDGGTIYAYYASTGYAVNWSDPSFTSDLYGVAVKPPGSPGYGLGVGVSASSKISYQVSDSSTEITLDTAYPHLTSIDFRDSAGNSKLNKQVDVGSTYYFLMDGYYMVNGADSWSSVNLSIKAWYDGNSEIPDFSSAPQGGNIRFRLDYNGSAWKLVEPTSGEITLGAAGTETTSTDGSGNVHHVLSINITFGPQVRYAPGSGWNASADEHNATVSFNDQNSWNFNITAFDRDHPTAGDSMYDEFGIFAYTEISASQNPYGAGPPGTNITLNPSSRVVVSTNIDYHVSVNVTDLKNATGGHTISRTNIWVNNTNATSSWTNFTGNNKLWVWGGSFNYLAPADNGIYTVENSAYNTNAYTAVQWRVYVPVGTAEDHFTATITFEISYP